ncbi:MAG TPA: molybdenum cofactor guanylyltransferase [Solirubrobacteraceae bacterium]
MSTAAGIVLAGGRSSRMGTPKAGLEWHGSTLLRRVSGIVARGVEGPVVVVRAPGQPLPALPAAFDVVEDAREGRGPLQGLAAGLAAVDGRADVAYVAATDAALLHPAFVRRVVRSVDDDVDAVLPRAGSFPHPLAAAYRTTLLDRIEGLLAADRLRLAFLFEACRVRHLDEPALLADPALAAADPALDSLLNLNEPGDYEAARARPAPQITVQCEAHDVLTVRAATLAAAAEAAGVTVQETASAALNGDPIDPDPELPLAAGDAVAFGAAWHRSRSGPR